MNKPLNSVCEKRVFEKVFREYSKSVRNFILFKCGNPDQADDLTQDAFVKLWNNCAKVPYEKAKSFLFAVVKNDFFNQVEHQKVILKYQQTKRDSVNKETPEFVLREKEFQKELNDAINSLTEKQREVFLLNRIEKKKYKEIAEMLEISQKAVEKRMHQAMLHLRTKIKNYKL
ncbi:RNA polymerase sigma-70 factor [Pseudotenacibaculum sp. MALMAid0570]|uniref:RNA polymerase sigma factor n=1 Tax=Pseudotenacibaculum sp. MALMAid0570 TaxID=3143938 RepID=UPI0032DF0374